MTIRMATDWLNPKPLALMLAIDEISNESNNDTCNINSSKLLGEIKQLRWKFVRIYTMHNWCTVYLLLDQAYTSLPCKVIDQRN